MKSKNYLKAGIWYTIGNMLIKGISFISLPVFTRLLTQADFGKFNVFLSVENILYIILGLGLPGTIKIAFFDYKDKFQNYYSSILSLTIISTACIGIVANVAMLFLPDALFGDFWSRDIINLLLLHTLGTMLYNLISTKYVIEADYKKNLAMAFFYTLFGVLSSILLCYVIFPSQRYLARIIGNAIPLIVMNYGVAAITIAKTRTVVNKTYWKYALCLGSPLILHSLSMVVLQQIGKLMVNYYCGDAITGLYGVSVTLTSILALFLTSFDNAWAPWFYRGLDEGRTRTLRQGNNFISVFFACATIGFILIIPEIISIMTTKDYAECVYSAVPLAIAVFVNFMYLFAVNQEYYYKKTKTIAVGTIVAMVSSVILNVVCIPIFGYIVAAYVDIVCKFILFAIHTIVVLRWKKEKIVSLWLLFALLGAVSVIGIITILCYKLLIIRYAILVLLLALLSALIHYLWKNRMALGLIPREEG